MEKEQIAVIAEKVKAFAMGLIGICFVSMGATYFEEQAIYRVPRILLPIFNIFGNIGLAIGLILLGLGLMVYGFIKWKKFSQKAMLYPIIAIPVLALSIYLSFAVDAFKDKGNGDGLTSEERREAQIEDIRNMKKPKFKSEKVEKYFLEFDDIFEKFKENVQTDNEQGITDSENAYMEWTSRSIEIIKEVKDKERTDFASYAAQLGIKWHDVRTSVAAY